MIITWFKTKQDVWDTLKAMEEKWWLWVSGQNPIWYSEWKKYFDEYQKNWWFALLYKDRFEYADCDFYWKRYWDKINFKDAIKELTGKKIKVKAKISEDGEVTITRNKSLSYETQYLRSDWILFTKDAIDWKNIEDLKQEMNNHISEANKIRGLLKAHKNKF